MANPITPERFSREVLDTLEETFEKPKGIFLDEGASLFETLATVTAEEASRPVSEHCASIAAHVAHVHFHLDLISQIMRGEKPGRADWGHIWRTVERVTPEAWEASKAQLQHVYHLIHERIATDPNLWAEGNSLRGVLGVIVHAAYHLGEIRQALCTIRRA